MHLDMTAVLDESERDLSLSLASTSLRFGFDFDLIRLCTQGREIMKGKHYPSLSVSRPLLLVI